MSMISTNRWAWTIRWRMRGILIRSWRIGGQQRWNAMRKKKTWAGESEAPSLLHDQDDEINYRHPKRSKADFKPLRGPRSYDDTDGGTPSSLGKSQRGHSRDDVPIIDQTDDEPYEEEYDDEGEFEMYRVQGTLREWVTGDEVCRFVAKKFKEFLLTYVNPKNEQGDLPKWRK